MSTLHIQNADMPNADIIAAKSHMAARFISVFIATALAALVGLMALNVKQDAYWIWRETPPWLAATGGANRLIDQEMRRSKPLWYQRIKPSTVLIGSSTVYRGLNPVHMASTFNLGISALVARELPVLAAMIDQQTETRRVVVGLDYFMFTSFQAPAPISGHHSYFLGRMQEKLASLVNTGALLGLSSPYLARAEPGKWQASGFKTTPDFPPDITMRVDAAQNIATMNYRPETLAFLEDALVRLSGKTVILYLSPMSGAQMAKISAGGHNEGFHAWRADVAARAQRHGIKMLDLTTGHGFDDFDPVHGSSRHWVDNLHYKPHVGRWIMQQIGF